MLHSPTLFDPQKTKYETTLQYKLKMFLGEICAYGGIIPATLKEIAILGNFRRDRVRTLISNLINTGTVTVDEKGNLFLNDYVDYDENNDSKDNQYVKNFMFLTCEEFLNETRQVRNFVLKYVGHQRVYLGFCRPAKIKNLYNTDGTGEFSARTRGEMIKIIERAEKYLNIRWADVQNKDSFQVLGVKDQWIDMGTIESKGANLWVQKQLEIQGFVLDFIHPEAIWQLAKCMEAYYRKFGYQYASDVFERSLLNVRNAQRFLQLVYSDPSESTTLNDGALSAYFSEVMGRAEGEVAVQISMDLDDLEDEQIEASNSADLPKVELLNLVIKERKQRLAYIHRIWLEQFKANPEMFLSGGKGTFQVRTLMNRYMLELARKIRSYELSESYARPKSIN